MKFSVVRGALAASILFALSVPAIGQELTTEKDKVSYMIGMQIGGSLAPIKDEVDIKMVHAAIDEALAGKTPKLSPEEAMAVQKTFSERMQAKQEAKMKEMSTKNTAEGTAFLAKNKAAEGVKTTASGLQYKVVKMGTGPKPKATDTVKVHYTGTLLDGTKFDSSVDRGEPAQFALNAVIPGWTEAVAMMPVGSKWTIWVPSALGYGERGTPGPIGPNATLKFDIELLEIVAAAPATPAPAMPAGDK